MTDRRLLNILTLNIETKGYNIKISVENIAIIYRVCFKVLNTLVPKAKRFNSKGKITLFEINISKSFLSVTRTLTWSEIKLPDQWALPGAVILEPEENTNKNVEQIIETLDENVEILFGQYNRVAKFHITNFDKNSSIWDGLALVGILSSQKFSSCGSLIICFFFYPQKY